MVHNPSQRAAIGFCIVWTLLGFALPLVHWASTGWSTAQLGVWIGLGAAAIFAMRWDDLSVSAGNLADQTVTLAPVGMPLVAAYFLLEPWQTGILALITGLSGFEPWADSSPKRFWLMTAGAWGASAYVTTWLVGAIWGVWPLLLLVVPLAFAASIADYLVSTIPAYVHSRFVVGRPFVWTRNEWLVQTTDSGMAALAAGLLVPLAPWPWAVVVGAFVLLGLVIGIARLSTSERRHKSQADYLQDAFSRYVPKSVAEEIGTHAAEIELGGEERVVTVLFCDIRGFTAWSERQAPARVVEQLNELLHELSRAVMAEEGTLDKYTGDGLMAFWGAPLDQPDHAARAYRTALGMMDGLARCNDFRVRNGEPAFQIGIGVHTGPAVVGNIGNEDRLDYTAIGDTVNLAARLEAATKELGFSIVLSESTMLELPADYASTTVDAGEVSVKGRTEPVATHGLRPVLVEAEAEPADAIPLRPAADGNQIAPTPLRPVYPAAPPAAAADDENAAGPAAA